jgi:hypothetical protein
VFDQATAATLRFRLPHAAIFEAPGRAALEYALDTPKSLVTLVSRQPGEQCIIAIFRPHRTQMVPPTKTPQVRATGFLGLNDAPVLEEEEEVPEKRRWWQRWKE